MCILQQTTKVIGKSSITLFLLSQFQKLSAPFCSNIFNSCKQPTLLPQPHSSQRMRRSKPASRHNCSDASIPRFKMGDPSSGGWAQEILRNPIGKSKTIVSRLADDRKKTRSSMLRSVGLLFQGRSCVFSLSRPEKYTSFFDCCCRGDKLVKQLGLSDLFSTHQMGWNAPSVSVWAGNHPRCCLLVHLKLLDIWRFPKMVVPLSHPFR